MRTCAMISGKDDNDTICVDMLTNIISVLYNDFGVRKILSGVHKGKELLALDYLLSQKRKYPKLKIHGVFTHEEEANLWDESDRERLYHAIRFCDEEWILKPIYGSEMRFQRNIVMMDRSDLVFLLNRDQEIEFWASKLKKPIFKIDIDNRKIIPDIHLFREN